MASIKIKFRPSTIPDHEGTVYYQIIHERKVRQILSNYKVLPREWDPKRSMVIVSPKSERKMFILSIRERIRWDVERLNKISKRLEEEGIIYSVDDIIDYFNQYTEDYSLFNYMQNIITKLKGKGKIRTSETYTSALNSFKKFRNYEDIMLDNLNSEIMESYEAWHHSRGVTLNTISFYTRIIRAVYNRALEEEIIVNRFPFRHVYTSVDKTIKRALPLKCLRKLKKLDLSKYPRLDYARDIFLLSFMLRGMSFVDMAFLRKTDLSYGYISYRRRKTGQQMIIKWTNEMQQVLKKYPENTTPYLFPIIRKTVSNERTLYRNMASSINRSLKIIAKMIEIEVPLTLYVARHSWASIARSKGIPLSVISEGMGHDSESTTQIYLASLDTTMVDHANSLILKSLL